MTTGVDSPEQHPSASDPSIPLSRKRERASHAARYRIRPRLSGKVLAVWPVGDAGGVVRALG